MIHAYAPRVSNLKSKIPDVCDRKCLEIPEAAKFGGLVWLVKVDEHGRVVTGSTPTNKNGQATLCKGGRFYFENVKTGGVFFFIAVERSSQTCGVTVGKHKDTNKTTARNKWAESGRKGGERTPVHAARRSAARWHGCPTWAVDFCGGTEGEPLWPRFSFYNAAPLFIHFSPPGTGACQRHILSRVEPGP